MRRFSRFITGFMFCTAGVCACTARGGITADAVVEYAPGTGVSASFQHSNVALGAPVSLDGSQITSPFTPPFSGTNSIVIIGPTGHITLHLSSPISTETGEQIGVFTNTGLQAAFPGGGVTAKDPVATLGAAQAAIVSVSADNVTYVPLNGGDPIDLTMPSNAFNDASASGSGVVTISGGQTPADPFKPFNATLAQFAGLTYPQMETLLNGSFGGAWVDASPAGLASINYVRFDVPTGDRLVLDAVTGVPEPASFGLLVAGVGFLNARRKHSARHKGRG